LYLSGKRKKEKLNILDVGGDSDKELTRLVLAGGKVGWGTGSRRGGGYF